MTPDNETVAEPPLISAIITPHRSLGRTGFLVMMGTVTVVSFVAGIAFTIMGAWPVFGFFGLDVLLIWWAFRANYLAARAYEEVTVTSSELRLRKVSRRGEVREWTLNPVWTRIDREQHEEFGLQRLFLVSRGRRLDVAGFLAPDERANFADALAAAIGEARRGPTRTLLA